MKNLLKLSFITLLFCILFSGCNKDHDITSSDIVWVDASIVWAGDPAACGCGWQILIDNDRYKASNLTKDFEVDGLSIKLVYKQDTLNKFYCGNSPYPQKAIRIINIERQLLI